MFHFLLFYWCEEVYRSVFFYFLFNKLDFKQAIHPEVVGEQPSVITLDDNEEIDRPKPKKKHRKEEKDDLSKVYWHLVYCFCLFFNACLAKISIGHSTWDEQVGSSSGEG